MSISTLISPRLELRTPATAQVRFRVLRDGEVTAGKKLVRLSRSVADIEKTYLVRESLDAEYTGWVTLPAQLLSDTPTWLAFLEDATPPAKVWAQFLDIEGAGTYTLNISTGTGGGATDPATLDARVRVDGLPASREVVVVERPPSGDWRVAGHGVTDEAGLVTLDLDVTEGSLFAVGLDDYGTPFTPGLALDVGRRIRPSVFAGVLYQVTEAGVLPATEPEWWPITSEGSRELGTARAEAVRYYRPLAHGPVTAELT